MLNKKGFTLIEMLIAIAIFSLVMSAIYSALTLQMKHTSREYTVAEAEVEVGIAKGIIERDLTMAGYGLADDYSGATVPAFTAPRAASATNGDPDTLTLMGTALGIKNRGATGWSYISAITPDLTFQVWTSDVREKVSKDDRVILMEPSSRTLLGQGGNWLFKIDPSNGTAADRLKTFPGNNTYATPSVGTLVYGLCSDTSCSATDPDKPLPTQPFYAVKYYIKNSSESTDPANCSGPKTGANRVNSLLRAESRTTTDPGSGDPILSCVRDFQVAFGLDTDEKPTAELGYTIDLWDQGGVSAAGYNSLTLNKRLKQIRVYVLLQSGNRDPDYMSPQTFWVGDQSLGIGRVVTLTPAQRNYRWRVISMNITPRNIRR